MYVHFIWKCVLYNMVQCNKTCNGLYIIAHLGSHSKGPLSAPPHCRAALCWYCQSPLWLCVSHSCTMLCVCVRACVYVCTCCLLWCTVCWTDWVGGDQLCLLLVVIFVGEGLRDGRDERDGRAGRTDITPGQGFSFGDACPLTSFLPGYWR